MHGFYSCEYINYFIEIVGCVEILFEVAKIIINSSVKDFHTPCNVKA
jgi:hypothetical protein